MPGGEHHVPWYMVHVGTPRAMVHGACKKTTCHGHARLPRTKGTPNCFVRIAASSALAPPPLSWLTKNVRWEGGEAGWFERLCLQCTEDARSETSHMETLDNCINADPRELYQCRPSTIVSTQTLEHRFQVHQFQ
jgi:hypothetical protein